MSIIRAKRLVIDLRGIYKNYGDGEATVHAIDGGDRAAERGGRWHGRGGAGGLRRWMARDRGTLGRARRGVARSA